MKNSILFFTCLLFLLLALVSCNNDDDGTNPEDSLPTAYFVQTTVQNNSGRTVFVNILSSLTDEVDLSQAFEFPGTTRARAFNGKLYIFDSENVEIIRYDISEENDLIEEDRFSMAGTGAGNFVSGIAFVNEEYAVSPFQEIGAFIVWNPTAMEIRGTIDFPTETPDVSFLRIGGAGVDLDGRVYYSIGTFDFTTFANDPGARAFIVDPVANTAELVEDLTASSGISGTIDPNTGDYYYNGEAVAGFGRYNAPPDQQDPAASILRIQRGENRFDPTFNLATSRLNESGYTEVRNLTIFEDQFAAIIISSLPEEIAENPTVLFGAPTQLYIGSISDWSGTEISIPDEGHSLSTTFIIDNQLYISSFELESGGGNLYRLNSASNLELVSEAGGIEAVGRIR
ncbi:MAG: hypothetical protein AAGC64_00695 [Bacteroidota bacterium]